MKPFDSTNPRIVVHIHEGLVQQVACSIDAEVIVIDWDTEGADPIADGLVELPTANGGVAFAFVRRFLADLFKHCQSSDIDRALHNAGIRWPLDG